MTPRERVLQALEHKSTDRVPMGFASTPEAITNLIEYLGVQGREEVLTKLSIDIRRVNPQYNGPDDRMYNSGLDQEGTDIFGVKWKFAPNSYGRYPEIIYSPLSGAEDVEQVETYPWPRPEWFNYDSIAEQIDKVNEKDEYCINFFGARIFETLWYMRGFEQTMLDLLLNPEIPCRIMEKVFDFYLEYSEQIIYRAKDSIDFVCTGDDVGSQRGLLISPDTFREFIKPFHKKINDRFHEHGLKVRFHSCGNISSLIGDFIDMGVDILNPIQLSADGMPSAEALKEQYGKDICFQGGIDVQHALVEQSPQQVREEVRRITSVLGRGGGYILESTHNLQGDIPPENIVAMYQAWMP